MEAEKVLKGRKTGKNPGADSEGMRAEIRRLDKAKISGSDCKCKGDGRLEVAWKYWDVYEKILGEMQ